MEGKSSVILSVLIMSLVMAQIQVEAAVKCPNATAREKYDDCVMKGTSYIQCAQIAGCKVQARDKSPPNIPEDTLQNWELARSCCPSVASKNTYNTCVELGFTEELCAKATGCYIQSHHEGPCRDGYIPNIPFPPNTNDAVNEYCKLGCASSVCGALTLQNYYTSEVVNGAVEKCAKACSTFCNKSSMAALETA